MSQNGDPADWHEGCENDTPRNQFIIPTIQNNVCPAENKTLAFIGCATGYIPQRLSEKMKAKHFFLIDTDSERLGYAEELEYGGIDTSFFNKPIEQLYGAIEADIIIVSNTLLEFQISKAFTSSLKASLKQSGRVFVFLPDTLQDVANEQLKGNETVLADFIDGIARFKKIDKFTSLKMPFYAHRLSEIIRVFLGDDFILEKLAISTTTPRYFFLNFRLAE